MNKKKILFVFIGLLVMGIGGIFLMRQIAIKQLSSLRLKTPIKLSNIEINANGWINISLNEKEPRIITTHGICLMITEDKTIDIKKLFDLKTSHNIHFKKERFNVGNREVEALQLFENLSTSKSKLKSKYYEIYFPPHTIIRADLPIDEKMDEKEHYLREFLASNIKFLN